MKPLAIIPARGGSKRLPRKNIALLNGKPLLAYTIEAAKESGVFDCVCVSSEDDEILSVAEEYGADKALRRPDELAGDRVMLKKLCAFLLRQFAEEGISYDSFALLTPTNPLRTSEDIRAAYKIFCEEDANHVMGLVASVHPPQHSVWFPSGYVEPYFGWKDIKTQSQNVDQLYMDNGSINFAKTEAFLKEEDFYGSKVVPYVMPPERSVDIDTPLDLKWAEFLLSRKSHNSVSSSD